MLEKYKEKQQFFYNYFMNSFDKRRISHAYLIETNGVLYANDLALDLAKFLLCDGEYDNEVCDLIDSGNCPNLKIIGSFSDVKKEDIVSLKRDFSHSSLDSKKQVYIIYDAQFMNKASANSLLKFLEEPDGDVVAIILCDNVKRVYPTISSRCQIINLIDEDNDYRSIFVSLYESCDDENKVCFDEFVNEKLGYFISLYLSFEEKGTFVLGDSSIYEIRDCFREFLLVGYYLYFDVLCMMLGRNRKFLPDGDYFEKIMLKNESCDIIRKIDVIEGFIFNLRYNVNINLFIDNFFISLDGDL